MATGTARLGEKTEYPDHYDPGLLVSIPRAEGRATLPFPATAFGCDFWTAYEISWLDPRGKPVVAIGEFRVPCDTSHIVESKSLKLYLNSLNQERFESRDRVRGLLESDLSPAFGGEVEVRFFGVDEYSAQGFHQFAGTCIDDLDVGCDNYHPDAALLGIAGDGEVAETLHSHLLKSNCPVTGQPDWASVEISYTGKPMDRAGLLRYLVSFRGHQGFHENCVEHIFCDLLHFCRPRQLSVMARYTRRGGLDINPFRSTQKARPSFVRSARQ